MGYDASLINCDEDGGIITSLLNTDCDILYRPEIDVLNKKLKSKYWDFIVFSGHSGITSKISGETKNVFYLNEREKITISDIKQSLEQAISNGLQLVIFNSCDSSGWSYELGKLGLSYSIAMSRSVPDLIAKYFLQNFFNIFISGKTLHSAFKEAQQQLEKEQKLQLEKEQKLLEELKYKEELSDAERELLGELEQKEKLSAEEQKLLEELKYKEELSKQERELLGELKEKIKQEKEIKQEFPEKPIFNYQDSFFDSLPVIYQHPNAPSLTWNSLRFGHSQSQKKMLGSVLKALSLNFKNLASVRIFTVFLCLALVSSFLFIPKQYSFLGALRVPELLKKVPYLGK